MQKAIKIWCSCAVLLIAVFFSARGFAQSDVGSISGFVRDQSGAVVPNARVTIVNEGTDESHTVVADAQGHYAVTNLPPASYSMAVEAAGFSKF
jgi:hypothetical protein